MNTVTLPPQLLVALPVIITMIAGWLGSAKLPVWLNDLIVVLIFFAAVAASAIYGGQLSGDLTLNFGILAAYSAAVMSLPSMRSLLTTFQLKLPSPLSLLAASKPKDTPAGGGGPIVSGGMASRAVGPSPIPSRASVYPPQQSQWQPSRVPWQPVQYVDQQPTMPTGVVQLPWPAQQQGRNQGASRNNDVSGG